MSKRPGAAQKTVQRRKQKVRKHVELVAQATPLSIKEQTRIQEGRLVDLEVANRSYESPFVVMQREAKEDGAATHKGSASARLAARKAAPLMTAGELAYVKHDLITIGGLSGVMLTIILVLYVFLG